MHGQVRAVNALTRLKHFISGVFQRVDDAAANGRVVFDGQDGSLADTQGQTQPTNAISCHVRIV
jgi:hypothetical protein